MLILHIFCDENIQSLQKVHFLCSLTLFDHMICIQETADLAVCFSNLCIIFAIRRVQKGNKFCLIVMTTFKFRNCLEMDQQTF